MAITITVNSVDITAYVPLMGDDRYGVAPLTIEEDASGYTGKATFGAVDSAAALSLAKKQTVSIADGGTTLFSGYVAILEDRPSGADTVVYSLECQDKNILLEETVIESESYAQGSSDSSTIDDLFTKYLSSIDSTTYVSTLDASMEAIVLEGQTLRECLSMICERTGGRFYIDYDDYLHYFSAESNALAWNLSDNPNFSTTYPYVNLERRVDASVIIDKVLVIGNEVSGWVGTGNYEAIVWDPSIDTAQGVTDRGNAIIGRYENGLTIVTCTIYQDGARAGRDIDLTNSLLGLSAETLTIRRLRMTPRSVDGALRSYFLELGEAILTGAAASRAAADTMNRQAQQIGNLDDQVYDTDAPSAPTFTAGNATTGVREDADGHQIVYVRCTWGLVSDADLDHYEVQLADNTSFNWPKIQHVQAGETREAEWVGLRGNISYYARVRAVDWVGNYSAWSPASPGYLTITTSKDSSAPAQVTGQAAAGARTVIGVTWSANSEADLAFYEVQRSATGAWGGEESTVDYPLITHYIDEDFTEAQVAASTTFYYRIRAVDTSGNEGTWSATASASLSPIGSDTIAANAIIAAHVGANEIIANTANIQSGLIVNGHIHASTIEADRLNISTLSAITADMGTLTAGEIRVGTGTPGVNFTGFRIFSSYIAGYNSDTAQFYIDSSDGKGYAGGGVVVLDASGLQVEISTSTADIRSYQLTVSGTAYTRMAGRYGASLNDFEIRTKPISGKDSQVGYYSISPDGSGRTASLLIGAFIENSVATASISFVTYHDSAAGTISFSADSYATFDCPVFINETANAKMTIGLTINQGTNDDEILALKSSDVAHGVTTLAETDTYAQLLKLSPDDGGLLVRAYDDTGDEGMYVYAITASDNTAKSTAGKAGITLRTSKISGTGVTNVQADGNLVAISDNGSTRFLFDVEGEMHCDAAIGAGNDWDEWDDLALAADLSRLPRAQWDKMMRYRARDFERAGLVTLSTDENGQRHAFIKTKAMLQFTMCCFREVCDRLQQAEHKLALLEG